MQGKRLEHYTFTLLFLYVSIESNLLYLTCTRLNNILILDANQRSALAATRSLGRNGIAILTADETGSTLAGASRYSRQSLRYPSPYHQTENFLDWVEDAIQQYNIDMIFPMSEITCSILLRHREKLKKACIPTADFKTFDLLSDKYALFKQAAALQLPIPETYFISDADQIDTALKNLDYPVVLKPARSRIQTDGGWINTAVTFADNAEEARAIISRHSYFSDYPFMLQSYIQGSGQGVFALYFEGRPVCFFSHKRLREKPPQGGVSVLCESVLATTAMLNAATSLLNNANWSGAAMVEFKVADDGTPYLMEINARFWGSLQLSIDAGVDFPYLLYQLYRGETVTVPERYTTGIKSRWLLGDLDRLFIIMKSAKTPLAEKLREIAAFCKFFQPGIRYEINRFSDFKPFLFELGQYIKVNFLRR